MKPSDVAVVIAAHGDPLVWAPLIDRATESVRLQTQRPACIAGLVNTTNISDARNQLAKKVTDHQWLIFLDADDELDPTYVEAMMEGEGDIRKPSTLGVYEDGKTDDYPVMIKWKPLITGNHIVIGAMIRSSTFWEVGGFRLLPAIEDWDLWLRMELAGACISEVPNAIYRVHVRPNSRNQNNDALFHELQHLYAPQYRAKGLL